MIKDSIKATSTKHINKNNKKVKEVVIKSGSHQRKVLSESTHSEVNVIFLLTQTSLHSLRIKPASRLCAQEIYMKENPHLSNILCLY